MSLRDLVRAAREDKPKRSLVRSLDRFIVARSGRPSPREQNVWHPSEIVGKDFCPRLEVLRRRLKLPEKRGEVDVGKERIFDVGHAMHHWYQEKYLGPMGELWGHWRCSRCHTVFTGVMPTDSCTRCQWSGAIDDLTPSGCETACALGEADERGVADGRSRLAESVRNRGGCNHCGRWGHWEFIETVVTIPGHNILGRIDGLTFSDRPGVFDTVVDVKTANERRFGALASTGPTEQNKKQVNIYMHAAEKPKGCLLYVSKNDDRVAEFWFDYDRSLIEAELADTLLLEKCLADDSETPPGRHEECGSPSSKRAKNCVGCDACFAQEST